MTPRFLADENIDPDLVLGLRRRIDDVDFLRVQDVGLRTLGDLEILRWAAAHSRILISHDLKTMPGFVADRLIASQDGALRRDDRVPVGLGLERDAARRRRSADGSTSAPRSRRRTGSPARTASTRL